MQPASKRGREESQWKAKLRHFLEHSELRKEVHTAVTKGLAGRNRNYLPLPDTTESDVAAVLEKMNDWFASSSNMNGRTQFNKRVHHCLSAEGGGKDRGLLESTVA